MPDIKPPHPRDPGEPCYFPDCDKPATHKIGEEGSFWWHNLTTYLCCEHMQAIGLPCQRYPYEAAMHSPFPEDRCICDASKHFGVHHYACPLATKADL